MTMQVRLIAFTCGAPYSEYANRSIDEILVGIARISSGRDAEHLFDEPHKLLRHCLINGHWSVFQMANLVFEIETSRAIGRELLRHWSIRPQELSQRYMEIASIEPVELRQQSTANRQSSEQVLAQPELQQLVTTTLTNSLCVYKQLLQAGVARECARMVLPEAASTKLIMNGTVREWITTLNQRLHKTAQKEIREVAVAISEQLKKQCPIISRMLFNFEHADEIPLIDQLTLAKYGLREQVLRNKGLIS
jgi:thymidylate synthase (FAD)